MLATYWGVTVDTIASVDPDPSYSRCLTLTGPVSPDRPPDYVLMYVTGLSASLSPDSHLTLTLLSPHSHLTLTSLSPYSHLTLTLLSRVKHHAMHHAMKYAMHHVMHHAMLQDIAVAPLLVILPLLAGSGPQSGPELGLLVAKGTFGFGLVHLVHPVHRGNIP